eukprot:3213036-Lingulodinium_polyedra.AAC.1
MLRNGTVERARQRRVCAYEAQAFSPRARVRVRARDAVGRVPPSCCVVFTPQYTTVRSNVR